MRVYVVYSSTQVATRIIRELMIAPSLMLVGQCQEADLSVDLLRSSRPDVVLFQDLHMSILSFRALVVNIKDQAHPPRILVMTDSPYPVYWRECLRMGADNVYQTPGEVVGMVNALQSDTIITHISTHGGMS